MGSHGLSQRLSAAVEQAVEHAAPVDPNSTLRLSLCLLRLEADAVPVTGREQRQQSWLWAPLKSFTVLDFLGSHQAVFGFR
jgi:hypothetical protein